MQESLETNNLLNGSLIGPAFNSTLLEHKQTSNISSYNIYGYALSSEVSTIVYPDIQKCKSTA